VPLLSVSSELPSSYATVCGLRPKRRLHLSVEAFNVDGQTAAAHIEAFSPPSAPSVVTSLVTHPAAQESVAGFQRRAVLDWIPQHDDFIKGHAIYLGLTEVESMKLLCWVPHENSAFAVGHLELPIVHRNHTHSENSLLLADYLEGYPVHQEQELLVSTRTVGHLESPAYKFRLGEWQVLDEAVKCLTDFEATHQTYVSKPVTLSWTQTEALSVYD
jgi:hypothetical protein